MHRRVHPSPVDCTTRGVSAGSSRFVNSQFCGKPHVGVDSIVSFDFARRYVRTYERTYVRLVRYFHELSPGLEKKSHSVDVRLKRSTATDELQLRSLWRYSLNRLKINIEPTRRGRVSVGNRVPRSGLESPTRVKRVKEPTNPLSPRHDI